MDDSQQSLTVKEVAEREGMNRKTIERMCRRGDLPAYQLGKAWRIIPDYREQLMRNQGGAECKS